MIILWAIVHHHREEWGKIKNGAFLSFTKDFSCSTLARGRINFRTFVRLASHSKVPAVLTHTRITSADVYNAIATLSSWSFIPSRSCSRGRGEKFYIFKIIVIVFIFWDLFNVSPFCSAVVCGCFYLFPHFHITKKTEPCERKTYGGRKWKVSEREACVEKI